MRAFAAAVVLAIAISMNPAAFARASAQIHEPPCVGQWPVPEMPVDEALNIAPQVSEALVQGQEMVVQQFTFAWAPLPPTAGARCERVEMRRPGEDNFGPAEFLLEPTQTTFVWVPHGPEGEYCLRFWVLSADKRSESAVVCRQVTYPQKPVIVDQFPTATPTPPASNATASPTPVAPVVGSGTGPGSGVSLPWVAVVLVLSAAALAAAASRGRTCR